MSNRCFCSAFFVIRNVIVMCSCTICFSGATSVRGKNTRTLVEKEGGMSNICLPSCRRRIYLMHSFRNKTKIVHFHEIIFRNSFWTSSSCRLYREYRRRIFLFFFTHFFFFLSKYFTKYVDIINLSQLFV